MRGWRMIAALAVFATVAAVAMLRLFDGHPPLAVPGDSRAPVPRLRGQSREVSQPVTPAPLAEDCDAPSVRLLVSDARGEPVSGASVELFGWLASARPTIRELQALVERGERVPGVSSISSSLGTVELPLPGAGFWCARVSKSGFGAVVTRVVECDARAHDFGRVILQPGRVARGVVVDERGAAVRGVRVFAIDPELPRHALSRVPVATAVTADDGSFTLGYVPSSELQLRAVLSDGTSVDVARRPLGGLESERLTLLRDEVSALASGAITITGRVVDTTSIGLAGVFVDLFGQGIHTPLGSAVTDESGSYSFRELPAAEYRVRGRGDWRGTAGVVTTVAVDRASWEADEIILPRMTTVTGVVVSDGGEPVHGVSVYALGEPTGTAAAAQPRMVVSGPDGGFHVHLRQTDTVEVVAVGSDRHGRRWVSELVSAASDGSPLELIVSRGESLAGSVVDQRGERLGRAAVELRPRRGVKYTLSGRTDAEGRFVIEGLASLIAYDLLVSKGRASVAHVVSVADPPTAPIVVDIGARLVGRAVMGSRGQPVEYAGFWLQHRDTGDRVSGRTGRRGRFEVVGLHAGEWIAYIEVHDAGKPVVLRSNAVTAGVHDAILRFVHE